MDGGPKLAGDGRRTSYWPVFVAGGAVTAELGVFFAIIPLAVSGVVLFGGSCAGLVHEVGYGSSTMQVLTRVGGMFAIVGALVWVARTPTISVQTFLAAPAVDGIALRGTAVATAGLLLVVAGSLGRVWTSIADGRRSLVE